MVAGPVLVGLLAQLSSLGAGFFVMGGISLLAALLAALVL
jgi:hypothetical protein